MADPHDPSQPHHDHDEGHHDAHHEGHDEGEHIDFDFGGESGNPLSELGLGGEHDLHASSDDFDFTEPTDFAFPGGHEGSIDSGLFEPPTHDHTAGAGHAGAEFDPEHIGGTHFEGGEFDPSFPGGTTEMPDFGAEASHAGDGIPEAEATEAAVAEAEVAEEEKPAKKRRPMPLWARNLEWSLMVGLPLVAVVFNVIAIRTFPAKIIDIVWHISYLVLLLLIPYVMWRTKEQWLTPRITASYTVMLAGAAACLLTGVWLLGTELSGYGWQIKMKKVHLPSPLPEASTMSDQPASLAVWRDVSV